MLMSLAKRVVGFSQDSKNNKNNNVDVPARWEAPAPGNQEVRQNQLVRTGILYPLALGLPTRNIFTAHRTVGFKSFTPQCLESDFGFTACFARHGSASATLPL